MRLSNINKVPEGHVANNYICRKNFYALNVLIFAGYDHRMYDMVINVPGSFHDATTWRLSLMKPYLESLNPKAVVLGNINSCILTKQNK